MGRVVNIREKSEIEGHQERFIEELNILKQMDHPNIIKLHDVYEDSKRYFVVTE